MTVSSGAKSKQLLASAFDRLGQSEQKPRSFFCVSAVFAFKRRTTKVMAERFAQHDPWTQLYMIAG